MTETVTKRPRSWKARLLRTPHGAIRPILANAMTALREAPAWFGVFAYNEFSNEATLLSAPPWEMNPAPWNPRAVTPHDDLMITEWLQKEGITVDVGVAAQAVEAVAKDRLFHPVRGYLDYLEWDTIPRIGTWLHDYFGTEDNPYTRTVGRCMLVGAVARIYEPGCKVDNVPIIEGSQGIGKSSALRILFDPWFTDEIADLGSKDAAMQARGVWLVELAELEAMSRPEASRAKAFITRTTDRFRPPYGRRLVDSPRSCVLWGTTNSETYLKDETGGRRFWPIRARKVNLEGLARIRDQLWAEALEHYAAGTPWWIDNPDVYRAATEEQAGRYAGDPWDEAIQQHTQSSDEVSIRQVLTALGVETGRQTQSEMNRVARCLKALGWTRVQVGVGRGRRWIYRRGRKEE
jgi:predicted P-loop ATPase